MPPLRARHACATSRVTRSQPNAACRQESQEGATQQARGRLRSGAGTQIELPQRTAPGSSDGFVEGDRRFGRRRRCGSPAEDPETRGWCDDVKSLLGAVLLGAGGCLFGGHST